MSFLASLFGYLLNFIYQIVNNYGIAILLFTIVIKLLFLPISIKQQKTMQKTAKLQEKMKQIQFKYKNNPEQASIETMKLYKTEKVSPFSGCLSAILQIVLLISVFFMVQSPLTYMRKVDTNLIEQYTKELKEESSQGDNKNTRMTYPEIQIIKEKGPTDERVALNMQFLGLDLSSVPISNLKDPKVYVIPGLYVISSIISIKISNNMMQKKKEEDGEQKEATELDAITQANKNMMYMIPIMSVMVAFVAPLGLALYWLATNVLAILERVVLNKVFESKEEEDA